MKGAPEIHLNPTLHIEGRQFPGIHGYEMEAALAEVLPVGLCVLQKDWHVLYWNQRAEAWTGVSREVIVGQPIARWFPNVMHPDNHTRLKSALTQGTIEEFSWDSAFPLLSQRQPSLEQQRAFQVTAVPFMPPRFQDPVVLLVMQDVWEWVHLIQTRQAMWMRAEQEVRERKLAQAALARLSRYHELILQAVGNGIVGVDCDGYILFVNQAAISLLHCQAEEMVGHPVHAILRHRCPLSSAEEFQGGEACPIVDSLRHGVVRHVMDDTFERRQDGPFPVEFVSTPIWEHGQIVGAVVTFSDLTDRRRLEQEVLRYTMKLEEEIDRRTNRIRELEQRRMEVEKLAALAQIAAGVAHEINNPLAGIKNSFHLVKQAIPTTHRYYEYVGRIEKEIDRISAIIRRMYQLYRPDPAALTCVRVEELFRDVVLMMGQSLKTYQISIVLDVPPTFPPVWVPVRDITQVLCNLVQNAIQASPPGETVRLAAEMADRNIRFIVSDRGPGIPPHVLPHIFEPFFTTKMGGTQGGMGLGLAVSRSLVEASGGRLEVHTGEQEGTTFAVVLPAEATLRESAQSYSVDEVLCGR
ncbi:MAG: PAS domain-containing protein [Nitrospirae bacterium]|nr:MAG: PAS domain-containing protein [Nitrospirota bacterium]